MIMEFSKFYHVILQKFIKNYNLAPPMNYFFPLRLVFKQIRHLTFMVPGFAPTHTLHMILVNNKEETAMQEEAMPLVDKLGLKQDVHLSSTFPAGVPWVRYNGTYKQLYINIIWLGNDRIFGVNSVGTVSASLATYASVKAFRPGLIINAGTAGGFKAKGASISDIYLASDVSFHDRRIPIPVFDLYGIGLVQAFSTPNLLNNLKLKVGKLSTGNSLDISPEDEASIVLNDATVKDMEGAGVAYVANLMKVPVIFAKGVTDIVDGDKPTAQEFRQNLAAVTIALDRAVTEIVDFINGKALHEL